MLIQSSADPSETGRLCLLGFNGISDNNGALGETDNNICEHNNNVMLSFLSRGGQRYEEKAHNKINDIARVCERVLVWWCWCMDI